VVYVAKKQQSFEAALKRLEEIVELMENPDTGIESLVNYYKEAVDLAGFLNGALNKYELQVTELTKTAEGFAEKSL